MLVAGEILRTFCSHIESYLVAIEAKETVQYKQNCVMKT